MSEEKKFPHPAFDCPHDRFESHVHVTHVGTQFTVDVIAHCTGCGTRLAFDNRPAMLAFLDDDTKVSLTAHLSPFTV